VQKHQKVLDVGCGNGSPTLEIARFLDANIVGVDLNEENIRQAKKHTAQARLDDQVTFMASNFLNMEFEEEYFDAAYSLEATCYAPDLTAVYTEIFRVIRPGGKFVVLESVLGSGYRDDDPAHRQLLQTFEELFGHTGIKKDSTAIEAMKQAGFEVEVAEDLADRPDEIPWYYPFDGTFGTMASLSDTFFKNYFSFVTRSFRSRGILYHVTGGLEKLKVLPSGAQRDAVQVMKALDALREVGQKKIITTMFLMVGKKCAS
jgi:sterol 24-C-methyltransferase